MDIVPYVAAAQEYVQTHPTSTFLMGIGVGWSASNGASLAIGCFNVLMKFPPFRLYILADPKRAKDAINTVEEALDKAIDDAAKTSVPPPVSPPP